jgi:hypothetical protein
LTAALVALPWYLKNYIWTGNPVFPYYLHQNLIDPTEIELVMDYLKSFGTGKRWYDYVLLPVNIYTHYTKFGTFAANLDMPNPLYLFVLIYPFIRKKIQENYLALMDGLAILSAMEFIAWAIGSQQNRFLMPLAPGLSIIASSVIMSFSGSMKRIRLDRVLAIAGVGGMVIVSLGIMLELFISIKPYNVILGKQSKSEFLASVLYDYAAIDFINDQLPENTRVFMPWDGRGYYCNGKCFPDVGQSKWSALIKETTEIKDVNDWLQLKKVTHILLNNEDIAYFLYGHDPNNDHRIAYDYLLNVFVPNCTEEIYKDDMVSIFEITTEYGVCQ